MRLSAEEVSVIKAAAAEAFGPDAVVRLFGSRTDDAKRGGDVDLHVSLREADTLRRSEIDFRVLLHDRLDEEPVDVVVHVRGTPLRWIDRAAFREGIVL